MFSEIRTSVCLCFSAAVSVYFLDESRTFSVLWFLLILVLYLWTLKVIFYFPKICKVLGAWSKNRFFFILNSYPHCSPEVVYRIQLLKSVVPVERGGTADTPFVARKVHHRPIQRLRVLNDYMIHIKIWIFFGEICGFRKSIFDLYCNITNV